VFSGCECLYCARCPKLKNVSSTATTHGRNCYPWLEKHIKCRTVSPVWSFESIIWKYTCTKLCVLQFIVENVRNTQRNVWLSGDIKQLNAPVHFKKGIYKPHCVYRRGRAWDSVSLLVVNIRRVLVESGVSYNCTVIYKISVCLHLLVIWILTFATKFTPKNLITLSNSILDHVPSKPAMLKWSYSDRTRLRCSFMATWRQRTSTFAPYIVKLRVRHSVPLFLNSLAVSTIGSRFLLRTPSFGQCRI
jgi:hypothetical protein